MSAKKTHYEILGIAVDSKFAAIKKAYYKKAHECHPDLFGNDPVKTAEFQQVVEAFNVLSDPDTRRDYDERYIKKALVRISHERANTVLDNEADDILEELIVGNTIPAGTTLMTFLRDLERTEIFMLYREAKNELDSRHFRQAIKLFQQLTYRAPLNILYHVYLGRALAATGKFVQAKREYATAIMIGSTRTPPLYMRGVKDELDSLLRRKSPLLYRIFRFFYPKEYILPTLPDEQMRQDTNRAISNLLRERERLAAEREEASRKMIEQKKVKGS